jgi:kynurenine formamidase
MPKLVDLTRPLQSIDKSKFPDAVKPLLRIIVPEIDFVDHKRGAAIMRAIFSCNDSDLPAGEGWAEDDVTISTHLGTHVDAPWHYGSTCAGKKARTVDQISLEELYLDGLVLDLSEKRGTSSAITIADLEAAQEKCGRNIKTGDAVLIRTDHDKYELTDLERYRYPGMTRESALWLAERGAKVGGTDALGWDRPFLAMIQDWVKTGDKKFIWDAHYAYRDVEVFVVQQLVNLDKLPPHGFKVGFFPIPLVGASAAPARVVAFLDDR